MVRDQRASTAFGSVVLAVLLGAGVVACGDDSDEDASPSTADFCQDMQQLDQDDDVGPFTEFYDRHPEPTPADWAADGRLVTEFLQAQIDTIEAVRPSKDAQPLVRDVLAAFEVMKQNSIDVSTAGKNDDQSALDELERVNQETNVPALMASIERVAALCAPAES